MIVVEIALKRMIELLVIVSRHPNAARKLKRNAGIVEIGGKETTMKILQSLKLSESPDHTILYRPWIYELTNLRCSWSLGSWEQQWLELELEAPLDYQGRPGYEDYIFLKFSGVFDLYIPMGDSLSYVSIRIIDVSQYISNESIYLSSVPAPIRVQHPKGDGLSFWAQSVEKLPILSSEDN